MEEQKPERNVRKHLASLHRRIQHKYLEMQKKLEKSKSVDNISNMSDDFNHNDFDYGSMDDLRETDEVFLSEVEVETKSLVVQNVHTQKAISRDLELEATFAMIEDNRSSLGDWEKLEPESPDSQISASIDSLNEIGKNSDDSTQPTPPPRGIRERFLAARERRREEKEKQSEKKKEKMEKLILTNSKLDASAETRQSTRSSNKKNKLATVTVAFIEVSGLESVTDGKERMLFCRFRLGSEKGKTKTVKSSETKALWQELFNINMFDEHMLEISCFDYKIFLGRHVLDLSEMDKDKTHKLTLDLQDGETSGVKIFVLLTISGISLLNTLIEIGDIEKAKQSLVSTKSHRENVGSLSVIVYGAKGLSTHDCYCVLKLTNERVQTHTEYKTSDPNWMKIFTFRLTDITRILEIAIFDERRNEEVGKISIPLLNIYNGEKIWYALKDSSQRERAKGNNPRILLEMRTSWKLFKSSVRVINPKEEDLLRVSPKVDRRVFARNLSRSKIVVNWTLDTLKLMKTCFEWESRRSNSIALVTWIIFCYFFKLWMLPLLFLVPFIKYRPAKYKLSNILNVSWWKPKSKEIVLITKPEKEEKSSLRQKINSLTEMVQSVQNGIGKLASIGESVKNLVNFTVPFVSLLAVFFILVFAFIMFIVPLKYILICWGIHKYTRKILRPNRIPNSEILDLLSRVPDDETLLDCAELPLELEEEEEEKPQKNLIYSKVDVAN